MKVNINWVDRNNYDHQQETIFERKSVEWFLPSPLKGESSTGKEEYQLNARGKRVKQGKVKINCCRHRKWSQKWEEESKLIAAKLRGTVGIVTWVHDPPLRNRTVCRHWGNPKPFDTSFEPEKKHASGTL